MNQNRMADPKQSTNYVEPDNDFLLRILKNPDDPKQRERPFRKCYKKLRPDPRPAYSIILDDDVNGSSIMFTGEEPTLATIVKHLTDSDRIRHQSSPIIKSDEYKEPDAEFLRRMMQATSTKRDRERPSGERKGGFIIPTSFKPKNPYCRKSHCLQCDNWFNTRDDMLDHYSSDHFPLEHLTKEVMNKTEFYVFKQKLKEKYGYTLKMRGGGVANCTLKYFRCHADPHCTAQINSSTHEDGTITLKYITFHSHEVAHGITPFVERKRSQDKHIMDLIMDKQGQIGSEKDSPFGQITVKEEEDDYEPVDTIVYQVPSPVSVKEEVMEEDGENVITQEYYSGFDPVVTANQDDDQSSMEDDTIDAEDLLPVRDDEVIDVEDLLPTEHQGRIAQERNTQEKPRLFVLGREYLKDLEELGMSSALKGVEMDRAVKLIRRLGELREKFEHQAETTFRYKK